MAEIGFFGALMMLIVILTLFRRNARLCRNPYARVCVYSVWVAVFASSAVSSSFFAATKAMVMGALVSVFLPIAEQAEEAGEAFSVREKFVSFWKNNNFLKNRNINSRFRSLFLLSKVLCKGLQIEK